MKGSHQEEGIFSLYSSSFFGIWMIMKLEETKQNEKEIKVARVLV
jgi:hypothetical protein